MKRLLVRRDAITHTQIDEIAPPALSPGQARCKIVRFALTANNVTYAAAGEFLKYWAFFPTGVDGQGVVPVWGVADVVETAAPDVAVGTRLYGYWPMAEELLIRPKVTKSGNVVDDTAHRADLPAVYNRYQPVAPQDADQEGLQALLQPLLATSYLLCDWLEDNAFFGARQIIIGSASSKTGLGLCKYLAALEGHPVEIIGLTSAKNAAFVASLQACDQVLSYDDVDELAQAPAVYVDMAGNAVVKARLHTHLLDVLTQSVAVGTAHWDQFQPAQDLAGPKPVFFFAPSQVQKRRSDWGPGVVEARIEEAWTRVAQEASSWMDLQHHAGLERAQTVYDTLARGAADPRDGHVITLG